MCETGRLPRLLLLACALALPAIAAAGELRDPTRPPDLRQARAGKVAPKAPRFRLASTLVSGERRAAVINGRVLEVGDRIHGARVVAIQPEKVRLRRQGRDITLVLLKQNIKQPSREGSGRP